MHAVFAYAGGGGKELTEKLALCPKGGGLKVFTLIIS